ncbi:MAG: hypothetical protein GY696_09005 [Gammaproteobacteria bacterium]|nr:hypothetical protein [Gammaproteobacteria bacterium]
MSTVSVFQAAMENLLSGAMCGCLYAIFAGQPLTIIGSTGPVLVFETIIYDFCQYVHHSLYSHFIFGRN